MPDSWPGEEVVRSHRVPENRPWAKGPAGFVPELEPEAEDGICLLVTANSLQAPGCHQAHSNLWGAPDANFKVAEVNSLP